MTEARTKSTFGNKKKGTKVVFFHGISYLVMLPSLVSILPLKNIENPYYFWRGSIPSSVTTHFHKQTQLQPMTKVLEARMQRHPGLIFARAACSSLQHNSIVSCPRHRDLRGRRRTFAGSTRQPSRPPANLHGEHEPPRQAEAPRRAGPSWPPANLRGKHTPSFAATGELPPR